MSPYPIIFVCCFTLASGFRPSYNNRQGGYRPQIHGRVYDSDKVRQLLLEIDNIVEKTLMDFSMEERLEFNKAFGQHYCGRSPSYHSKVYKPNYLYHKPTSLYSPSSAEEFFGNHFS